MDKAKTYVLSNDVSGESNTCQWQLQLQLREIGVANGRDWSFHATPPPSDFDLISLPFD